MTATAQLAVKFLSVGFIHFSQVFVLGGLPCQQQPILWKELSCFMFCSGVSILKTYVEVKKLTTILEQPTKAICMCLCQHVNVGHFLLSTATCTILLACVSFVLFANSTSCTFSLLYFMYFYNLARPLICPWKQITIAKITCLSHFHLLLYRIHNRCPLKILCIKLRIYSHCVVLILHSEY